MRVKGNQGIYVVGADGGPVVRRVGDSLGSPSWSHDGRWIYFASNRTGRFQVWKIPSGGGSAVQVTHDGGVIAFESPDGAVLYYSKGTEPGLWKKNLPEGEEIPVLTDFSWAPIGFWQVTSQGIWFVERDRRAASRAPLLKLLPHAGGPAKVLATLDEAVSPHGFAGGFAVWHPLAVSPDREYLLITELDQRQSNIMVAEGFH
jgi:hypothetical protein